MEKDLLQALICFRTAFHLLQKPLFSAPKPANYGCNHGLGGKPKPAFAISKTMANYGLHKRRHKIKVGEKMGKEEDAVDNHSPIASYHELGQ